LKKLFFLVFFSFIFTPFLAFGQQSVQYESFDSIRCVFVTAANGLRMRATPALDSEVYAVIPFGTLVNTFRRTTQRITIDGITEHWYEVDYYDDGFVIGWVFGGYLAPHIESKPFAGRWVAEGNSNYDYVFHYDNTFSEGWNSAQTMGERRIDRWGTYVLTNHYDVRFTVNTRAPNSERVVTTTETARVRYMNINRIILVYGSRQVVLVRDNNLSR